MFDPRLFYLEEYTSRILGKIFMWVTAHSYRLIKMKISPSQKAVVRRKLLEEAAKHFARLGFDEANINEIATGAGYAKGTIYNYFKNKEELFGEVVAEAARLAVERYRSAPDTRSTKDSLKELARSDVSVLREEEAFIKVLAAEALKPMSENFGLILAHLGEFIQMISEILENGLKKGEVRDDVQVPQLALVFLGLLTLLYIQHWKSDGSWPSLEEIPDLVATLFIDGAGKIDPASVLKPAG